MWERLPRRDGCRGDCMPSAVFINPSIHRGVGHHKQRGNRFNGFSDAASATKECETVETVRRSGSFQITSLKRGVNETPSTNKFLTHRNRRRTKTSLPIPCELVLMAPEAPM